MAEISCSNCKRSFKSKGGLTTHLKKCAPNPADPPNSITEDFQLIDISEDTDVKISNVSNREALKSAIHEIHNYLRNNGAGHGMSNLKIFNVLYGLKKMG